MPKKYRNFDKMDGPLTELRNQRLPRRKMAQTYGKKKNADATTARRELFGSDENELEKTLENLNLKTPRAVTPAPRTSIKRNTRIIARQDTSARTPTPGKPQLVSSVDATVIEPLLSMSGVSVDLFTDFGSKLLKSFDVEKIGEGSFAEVFKLKTKTSTGPLSASMPRAIPAGGAIIKVIPLNTPSAGQDAIDRLSSVDSVAREIQTLRTLDSIHGFTRFRGVRLVTGLWPPQFLGAFRRFRRVHRKRAINRSPEDEFEEKQIYAIVEMNDAGVEISTINRPSVFQVYDIFWMTTILLANAEEKAEVEHRDLHLSNICVKSNRAESHEEEPSDTEPTGSRTPNTDLDTDRSILANMTESDVPSIKLGLSNLKITIIDYTITRCLLDTDESQSNKGRNIAYDNMLFITGLADSGQNKEDNLQYKTYRKTRAAVQYAQRTEGTSGDEWKQFVPRTNVCWLAYLLQTLSRRAKARHLNSYVIKGSSEAAKMLQKEMWDTLGVVEDVVCGVDTEKEEDEGDEGEEEFDDAELERTPASAGALLVRAVEEGWLSREEIEAFKERLEVDS